MRVTINLATTPAENNRRFMAFLVIFGGAVVILSSILALRGYREWRDNRWVEREIAQLSTQLRELTADQQRYEEFLHRPQVSPVLERAAYLNSLIQRKSISWTRIFMELERQLPDRVYLVSITPRVTEDNELELKLSVAGESTAEIIRFLKTLEASPEFSQIELQTERHATGPGTQPIVVELSAHFHPPEGD